MAAIYQTAYPRLKSNPSVEDLVTVYTPSNDEIELMNNYSRRPIARLGLMILLKTFQRLGYFVLVSDVPEKIVNHIMECLESGFKTEKLDTYDTSGTRQRHMKIIRDYLGVTPINHNTLNFLKSGMQDAATTKEEVSDIINIGLESMTNVHYELPSFSTFLREANAARAGANRLIYENIYSSLSTAAKEMIQNILSSGLKNELSKSLWEEIKQEPKKPTLNNVRSFAQHLHWLRGFNDCLPQNISLPESKLKRLITEARALNISDMNKLSEHKKYTLVTLFIQSQTQKALDDITDIFIRIIQKIVLGAQNALKEHQISQTRDTDNLVMTLRDIIKAYQTSGTKVERFDAISDSFKEDPKELEKRCERQLAYSNNNYLPFMLPLFQDKRSVLFDCISHLNLLSTTQDESLLEALSLVMFNRRSRKPTLDTGSTNLSWIQDKWWRLITGSSMRNYSDVEIQRNYFELCLFTTIAQELKSGDLVVESSDKYSDFRDQLISWEEYELQIDQYGEQIGINTKIPCLIADLKRKLSETAWRADDQFPDNDQVKIENGELSIQRIKSKPIPIILDKINKAMDDRMMETNILDILTHMEKWLSLSKGFKPLSGHQTKLMDHQRRFIITLFCYGCNLGPTQTSRSITGINRKQIAWLNLHHSTEDKIDEAIVKVINAYNKFSLPKIWGTGQSTSVDGTKWDLYEQNLLSEYHVRYMGSGGIGYYHLSDTYIALFSHFIPCGVYEAIYILDGILKNKADIQPDTIHGDTQSQSEAVFGLAYLLGIKLMPRIRGIKDLKFYRADKEQTFQHIDSLFKDTIKWDLIENNLPDILRIALSIKSGKVNASTILRRLGTYSRKNKLYLALRELGRVIRTIFLLEYITESQMREMIHSATCKSEEFNDFLQWVMFGNNGLIAENIRHEQQKVIKYNHLVANMIILYNVITMTNVVRELSQEGLQIDAETLAATSPFRRENINRFGTYSLDMHSEGPKIEFNIPINLYEI